MQKPSGTIGYNLTVPNFNTFTHFGHTDFGGSSTHLISTIPEDHDQGIMMTLGKWGSNLLSVTPTASTNGSSQTLADSNVSSNNNNNTTQKRPKDVCL